MKTALLGAVALVALLAAAPATPKPGATVHIRDDAFTPATITVRAGDSVTFVNDDDDAHTVTAHVVTLSLSKRAGITVIVNCHRSP